jgi:translation elongation factor EF-1alpha
MRTRMRRNSFNLPLENQCQVRRETDAAIRLKLMTLSSTREDRKRGKTISLSTSKLESAVLQYFF